MAMREVANGKIVVLSFPPPFLISKFLLIFVSFIFSQTSSPPKYTYVLKDALNHFLVHSRQKTVSEVLKTRYFPYSAF